MVKRGGVTDLHAHFERERAAEERARRAEDEAARRAQEEAQRSTLRQLLEAYVAHLERLGKQADVELDTGIIVLHDSKGARRQPRRHVVPLSKAASAIFERRLEEVSRIPGSPLFSTDGRRTLHTGTLAALIAEISAEMIQAKEAREGFEMRDLRRTAETVLASLGVSSDVRAQLQSHGLGGVQMRHYDRHDYALEKRAAVELWLSHLERLKAGKVASVTSIGQGKKPDADRLSSQGGDAG